MGFVLFVLFWLSFTSGLAGRLDGEDRDPVALSIVIGLKTHGRREMLVKGHEYLLSGTIFSLQGQPGNCPVTCN